MFTNRLQFQRPRLLIGMLCTCLMIVTAILPTAATRSATSAALGRSFAPVIIKGIFAGTPVNQLFVYRFLGGKLEQIPFQIDEVNSVGRYVSTEDELMDANDELVFMASDMGEQAIEPLNASLAIKSSWQKISVSDPLDPTKQGWVYVVASNSLSTTSTVDYAHFDAAAQRISTPSYTIAWAADHIGLRETTLFSGSNVLDRSKLRIDYTFLGRTTVITEGSVLLSRQPAVAAKDGPVRVIAYRGMNLTIAYGTFFHTSTPFDLSGLPAAVIINAVRFSTDFNSGVVGSTHYDEHAPDGVVVDGVPDSIPSTPYTASWSQTSLASGSLIEVFSFDNPGGTTEHYYKDSAEIDPIDSGDKLSYGDSGVLVQKPSARQILMVDTQYVLPDKQPNRGAEFLSYTTNPLAYITSLEQGPTSTQYVYLPVVMH